MSEHDDPVLADIAAHTGEGWYGLSTGPGWHDLVKDAHHQIVARHPDYVIHQIKEKYGELRYYCSVVHDPQVQAVIAEAELQAQHTCEACGSHTGVTRGPAPASRSIKTRCSACATTDHPST